MAIQQRQVHKLPGHNPRRRQLAAHRRPWELPLAIASRAGHAAAQQGGGRFIADGNVRRPVRKHKLACAGQAAPSVPESASTHAAKRLRAGAHPEPPTITPAFADSTASRETATTGICAGSASPFTALKPDAYSGKASRPIDSHNCAHVFQLPHRHRASRSPTAATSVAE